ncbi:hypothetical protein [Metabacillus sp. B2-18]|uniref:hypothetical protein n=1 Tax=Metabacillus sp. B2-18 TaxID=2897333 RepID=UPI001E51A94A|nr:hypothetical protein [Metabacillus sp. B2-18]UGB30518.1 hypothetical protein LPC09_22945 [Metabacillus sp. B2-18]
MTNKKIIYFIAIFILCLVSWVIYSLNQPPEWEGYSQNKDWKTTFKDERSPKGFWNGNLTWNGKETVTISNVILTKNGTELHSVDSKEEVENGHNYNYLTTTETIENKKDEVLLTINWNDKNGSYEEVIRLEPKIRYFVVPLF